MWSLKCDRSGNAHLRCLLAGYLTVFRKCETLFYTTDKIWIVSVGMSSYQEGKMMNHDPLSKKVYRGKKKFKHVASSFTAWYFWAETVWSDHRQRQGGCRAFQNCSTSPSVLAGHTLVTVNPVITPLRKRHVSKKRTRAAFTASPTRGKADPFL